MENEFLRVGQLREIRISYISVSSLSVRRLFVGLVLLTARQETRVIATFFNNHAALSC